MRLDLSMMSCHCEKSSRSVPAGTAFCNMPKHAHACSARAAVLYACSAGQFEAESQQDVSIATIVQKTVIHTPTAEAETALIAGRLQGR